MLLSYKYIPSRESAPLLYFLEDMQKATGVSLAYSSNYLPLERTMKLPPREQTLAEALKTLIGDMPVRIIEKGGKIFLVPLPKEHIINGFVKEAGTGEALIGASVYDPVTRRGTLTNAYGFYSLWVPDSTRQLRISFIGHTSTTSALDSGDMQRLDVFLEISGSLQPVTVTGKKQQAITRPSDISLDGAYLQRNIPLLLGEQDALRNLALYPGISSSMEGSSNFVVRGGSPDQNLYLLDGVPLYNVNHTLGLFSVFNGDAVNSLQVYTDNFPAKFGGRLSSVWDIRTKDGDMREWHGKASLGLISGSLLLEGPLKKERSSMMLSVRRSWLGDLVRAVASDENGTLSYNFYDINFKLNYEINKNNRLYLSFYRGGDKLKALATREEPADAPLPRLESTSFQWGNTTAALKWSRINNPRFFSHTSLVYSFFRNGFQQEALVKTDDKPVTTRVFSELGDVGLRNESEYSIDTAHHITFGAGYGYHRFSLAPYGDILAGSAPVESRQKYEMSSFQAYLEDEMKLFRDHLIIQSGLHFAGLKANHRTHTSLQPRFMIKWATGPLSYVQMNISRMVQFLHLLTHPSLGLPTDMWVPSIAALEPEKSWQYSIGYKTSALWNVRFSANAFYKHIKNVINYGSGAYLFDNPANWINKIRMGEGASYGAEWLMEKRSTRLSYSAAYTLAWAWRRFNDLNKGLKFPYKYDRRHRVVLAAQYQLKKNWGVAAVWSYSSGTPLTVPDQLYPDVDPSLGIGGPGTPRPLPETARLNNFRLPDTHHLDVSADYHFAIKGKREHTLSVGIYNIYNRINPAIATYDDVNRKIKIYDLGTVPSINYSFKF